jgi:hypothetical protein
MRRACAIKTPASGILIVTAKTMEITIAGLKELASRRKSIIRVFGRLDVHFFSINPEGLVDSPVMEIIPQERMDAFFADVLAQAERFLMQGRFWKRDLDRAELEQLLGKMNVSSLK